MSPPPERPKSRLARWKTSKYSVPTAVLEEEEAGVLEEAEEDLIRSATPRGIEDFAAKKKESKNQEALQIAWQLPQARVYRQASHPEYDVAPLVRGQRISELWFPTGDTLIYLCSKAEFHRFSPSFKLSAATLRKKSEFFTTALSERWQQHNPSLRELLATESAKYVLYFPPWEDSEDSEEVDTRNYKAEADFHELVNQLVATRNFFAYLFGRHPIYLEEPLGASTLSDFMDRVEMYVLGSNADIKGRPTRDQTLAELEGWVRTKEIDDPRKAPQRIIDNLMIAERYQWTEIYTEAFVHGAGRYDYISSLPDFAFVSPATRQLLERASYSIKARVHGTQTSLSTLNFSMFSPTRSRHQRRAHRGSRSDESSTMDIPRAWRKSYRSFREWVIQYYTGVFRVKSWPPAHFSRGMILMLKNDFQALYELLLDPAPEMNDQYRRLLAQVLTEFDGNPYPPLPRLPVLPPEGSPSRDRRQNRENISVVLLDSYNLIGNASNKFVEAFKEFERSYGTGRVVTKSVEAREGRWCLVHAVVSTLRSVVGEWEGLKYRWGVEYWLCAELKGIPPWTARRSAERSTSSVGLFGAPETDEGVTSRRPSIFG